MSPDTCHPCPRSIQSQRALPSRLFRLSQLPGFPRSQTLFGNANVPATRLPGPKGKRSLYPSKRNSRQINRRLASRCWSEASWLRNGVAEADAFPIEFGNEGRAVVAALVSSAGDARLTGNFRSSTFLRLRRPPAPMEKSFPRREENFVREQADQDDD